MKTPKPKSTRTLFSKVVLIGPGLIGGSLALDLKRLKLADEVTGYARNIKTQKLALKKKICDRIGSDLNTDLLNADLVIIATPVLTSLQMMKTVAKKVTAECLVIDAGSTKLTVTRLAQQIFKSGNFVPCHPMAGKETAGPDAAEKKIFIGKKCVLTTYPGINEKKYGLAKTLWKKVGAVVLEMEASDHDQTVAVTSHFPQIIASALMNVVGRSAASNYLTSLIGTGLTDTTRLASSSASLWTEIVVDNRVALIQILQTMQLELKNLITSLKKKDLNSIESFFVMAGNFRKKLITGNKRK